MTGGVPELGVGAGLRIGLIGIGWWGEHILRDLRSLGCDVAVVARSGASVEAAMRLGAAHVVDRPDRLDHVDGLVVATPSTTHAEVVRSVLDRNVPVFVEKPFTTEPSDADDLVELAGDRIFVMDKWRYHGGVLAMADIARSGELGPVIGLRSIRLSTGNPHKDTDAIWTLAPHDIAIALEVLGEIPEPRAAVADRDDGDVTGITGLFGGSPWLVLEVSGRYVKHVRELRLHCLHGTALLGDAYSDHLVIARGRLAGQEERRDVEERAISKEMPLFAELRAFVQYLKGGDPPKSPARDGARVVGAIARMRELAGLAP